MFLSAIAMAAWLIVFSVFIWATALALKQLSEKYSFNSAQDTPPVSLLKPLKGLEPGLERNLESCFRVKYPKFEILFCVADRTDPVCPLVEQLIQFHPEVNARLVVSNVEIGPNPKVNNLYIAYHQALYDHIVISDSNVRVKTNYLYQMVANLKDDVGAVSSMLVGVGFRGLGGYLEAAYLNAVLTRMMPFGVLIGMPLVLGKSMLFRRSVAAQFGGLDYLVRYLAEDYMTGYAMKKLGLKIALSVEPVQQYIGSRSFKSFWARHVRWGRLRKAHAGAGFFLELFSGAIISGLLGAWGLHQFTGISGFLIFAIHLALWAMWDLSLLSKNGKITPGIAAAWLLREVLALPLWCHAALGNTVEWRGRHLRLKRGGELELPTGFELLPGGASTSPGRAITR
jgi:ceramide glucosyltransferase